MGEPPARRPESATLTQVVRAAGGVVLRGDEGRREVLLVHRPRYGDWTFPKGKAEEGETDEECALREVHEETGLVCALGEELSSTAYDDAQGRAKVVRYWRMTVVGGELAFAHEVDTARWLAVEEARAELSYPRDRKLLDEV